MGKFKDLAVLILAAGTSSRLGEPKQLVKYEDKTLLYHACKKARDVSNDVYVVLGANYEECKKQIEDLDVSIIENKNYEEGLSSSIKEGVLNLVDYKRTLIMLCDQPFIQSSHLQKLVDKSQESGKIVCSYYKGDVAVPVVFPKEFYFDLFELSGDKGAKAVIRKNSYESIVLDDTYAFDVDTKEDKKYLNVQRKL